MKNMKKILSLVLIAVMVLTLLPTAALAAVEGEEPVAAESAAAEPAVLDEAVSEEEVILTAIDRPEGFEMPELSDSLEEAKVESGAGYSDEDVVRVVILLDGEESLMDQGFTQDEIAENTPEVAAAANEIEAEQATVMSRIHAVALGRDPDAVTLMGVSLESDDIEVRYHYSMTMNGLAVEMPYGLLKEVRKIAGVKSAFIAPVYSVPQNMNSSTVSPFMYNTQELFGSAKTWELEYTGKGMKVAVVDTGIDLAHPSFDPEAEAFDPGPNAMTVADYPADLTTLHVRSGFTASQLYRNSKIPFAYNYADASLNVSNAGDDHGTHVAGIVAANKIPTTDVVGVAPDAQIMVMKVFSLNGGGAGFDDVMAAVDDSLTLGADVVNLSLGSVAGFNTSDEETEEARNATDAVYASIASHGVIVAIAAGNNASAAAENALGTNLDFTSNPDNSTVSSPATYTGATVVGSVENTKVRQPYIQVGEEKMAYTDGGETYGNPTFEQAFGGEELTYVMVPGLGDVSDFEGVNVRGKIAVIARGTIDFVTKQANAADAGAIGTIVYDNVEGELIGMMSENGLPPAIFVSKASGAILASNAKKGEGKLTVPEAGTTMVMESSTGNLMSTFSSWGVSPNLELVPDVSAPGGNIYSSLTGGGYGSYSGTSMATPHIAGMSALVLQYLRTEYPLEDLTAAERESWYHNVAQALVMSTAEPLVDGDGILYSPRLQGAGSANVYSAVTSPVYLSVESDPERTPKVSLGDDPAKTGKYTFTFQLNNLTDEAVTYKLDSSVLTDQYSKEFYEEYDLLLMGETGKKLETKAIFTVGAAPALDIDLNEDGVTDLKDVQFLLNAVNGLEFLLSSEKTACAALAEPTDKLDTADVQWLYEHMTAAEVTVPANGSVEVTASVILSDADMKYIKTYYPNGIYVDGFVRCLAEGEDGVDLSLPFMAFCGDWSKPPVLDTGWWYEPDDEVLMSRYWNVMWTNYMGRANKGVLGLSMYLGEDDEYDPSHNVLSPNGDGSCDYIDDIYFGLMRNAAELKFTWTKKDDPTPLFTKTVPMARKSYYVSSYQVIYPFIYSDYMEDDASAYFDDAAMAAAGIVDGDDLVLTVEAYTVASLNSVEEKKLTETVSIPVHIDTETPTAEYEKVTRDNGSRQLVLKLKDNYDIASLVTVTTEYDLMEAIPVKGTKSASGEVKTMSLDLAGYDASFYLMVCDYGGNEQWYAVTFPGSDMADFNSFYAYRYSATISQQTQYGLQYGTTRAYNGWHTIRDAASPVMRSGEGDTRVTAADYVDGYIIGVDTDNTLFSMRTGTWNRTPLSDELADYPTILDMAFNWKDGLVYLLTDVEQDYMGDITGDAHLLTFDPSTLAIRDLGAITVNRPNTLPDKSKWDEDVTAMEQEVQLLTLACDSKGNLYAGDLAIAKATAEVDSGYGYTYPVTRRSSMESMLHKVKVTKAGVVADPVKGSNFTGYTPKLSQSGTGYLQSMTVDHDTDTIYWATYDGANSSAPVPSYLMAVDKSTGKMIEREAFEYNSEFVGLFKPSASGRDVFEDDVELERLDLSKTVLFLQPGDETVLEVIATPYYADTTEMVWTSDDEDVVTVEDGLVTAIAPGEAVITVQVGDVFDVCEVTVLDLTAKLGAYDLAEGGWHTMDAADPYDSAEAIPGSVDPYGMYSAFVAAAYDYDGHVFAFDSEGGFWKLDAETLTGDRVGVNSSFANIYDMSFSAATATLYAMVMEQVGSGWFAQNVYYLVEINPANGDARKLCQLDTDTMGPVQNLTVLDMGDGEDLFCAVVEVTDYDEDAGKAIEFQSLVVFAIGTEPASGGGGGWEPWDLDDDFGGFGDDDDFGVGGDGDEDTVYGAELLGALPLKDFPGYISGMGYESLIWSYDDNCFYFVDGRAAQGYYPILIWIDLDGNWMMVDNTGVVPMGLFELTSPLNLPEVTYADVESLSMDESFIVSVGGTAAVAVSAEPWNSRVTSVSYAIDDTTVASVDANGIITGEGEGTATLTARVVYGEDNTTEDLTASVMVIDVDVDLGGYLLADLSSGYGDYWVAFNASDPAEPVMIEDAVSDMETGEPMWELFAGAYYDESIYAYAQDYTGEFDYKFFLLQVSPFRTDEYYEVIGKVTGTLMDMTFDYTTGTLYGILADGDVTQLVQIEITEALDLDEVESIPNVNMVAVATIPAVACTVAAGEDGTIWSISEEGDLYAVAPDTKNVTEVGPTGLSDIHYYQSMHYDYVTQQLYWAQLDSSYGNGLYVVNTTSGKAAKLGTVIYGSWLIGMFSIGMIYDEPEVPATVAATNVSVQEKAVVLVDGELTLTASLLPLSVSTVTGTVTWSSDDLTVATVDPATGVVTGVAAGTAVITASLDGTSATASCTVTVLEEAQRLYAYDETLLQWISFATDGSDLKVEKNEKPEDGEEDVSPIVASALVEDTLYAYDADGFFYTIDLDTFARTKVGDGISQVEISGYDDEWNEIPLTVQAVDLAYDELTDALYVVIAAYDPDLLYGGEFHLATTSMICEVDLTDGTADTDFGWSSGDNVPANLVCKNGFYFVETRYPNGFLQYLTYMDYMTYGQVKTVGLTGLEYWGIALCGRGMVENPLDGTVYVIRNLADEGGSWGELFTISLASGNLSGAGADLCVDATDDGGADRTNSIISSLFIK